MKQILYILFVGAVAISCTTESAIPSSETPSEQIEEIVNPNQVLTMEIDGMVCKMGCGGSIRKGLRGTKGVASVEFDFEEDRKTNVAKVSYDKSVVSSEELVNVVSKLNEGQFLVGSVSFEDIKASTTINEKLSPKPDAEEAKINVSTNLIKFPNLFDLFSGLVN